MGSSVLKSALDLNVRYGVLICLILNPDYFIFLAYLFFRYTSYTLVTARSSGILKAKQKLGRTFNSDKLGGIAFTKISKLTMCSA